MDRPAITRRPVLAARRDVGRLLDMTLVQRDDLSRRSILSKSALTEFESCQSAAWHSIHNRLPVVPNERMTFGSAVDAAVEQIVVMLRSGNPVEMARVMAAVDEVIGREDTGVDRDEVERAAEMFVPQVARNYDWAYCRTQPSIDISLPDLGDINTHPDLVLAGNLVRDVKTGAKAKPDEPTLELGFYGLCVETETKEPVPTVGYFTWIRVARPYWQIREFLFTDELRRWTRERAGGYVRAKKADEVLNRKAVTPVNYSFPGGPSWPGRCTDCAYNPANGGPCVMARQDAEVA